MTRTQPFVEVGAISTLLASLPWTLRILQQVKTYAKIEHSKNAAKYMLQLVEDASKSIQLDDVVSVFECPKTKTIVCRSYRFSVQSAL